MNKNMYIGGLEKLIYFQAVQQRMYTKQIKSVPVHQTLQITMKLTACAHCMNIYTVYTAERYREL